VVQPLLTAVNLTILAALRAAGLRYQVCLGHSLGELAAWSASSGIEPEAAVELAARRGAILTRLAAASPGAMLLLRCPDAPTSVPSELLARARALGVVDVGVDNGPGQWVLSGDRSALATVLGTVELGDSTCVGRFLSGEGAWHSRLMAPGEDEYRSAIAAARPGPHVVPIIANAGGRLLAPGDDFVEPFVEQLSNTVDWQACMRRLAQTEVRELVLVGPGKTLAALARDNLPDALASGRLRVHRVEHRRDLERVCEALA
jgi:[acyl-carrier-protein] S-malonyltransferase